MVFTLPYILGITVKNTSGNPVTSTVVTLTNETSDDVLTETTNSKGRVVFDLGNFTSGYSDGDFVNYVVTGSSSVGEELVFKIVSRATGVLKDFNVYNEVD